MKSVFILEHSYEKGECDETKFIGIYSNREEAEKAVGRLKTMPGFRDRPDDFHIEEYELNKDHWSEGYSTMTTIQVKDVDDQWMVVQANIISDNAYQIIEIYENHRLKEFKHLDIVECEEKDRELFAIRRVNNDHI